VENEIEQSAPHRPAAKKRPELRPANAVEPSTPALTNTGPVPIPLAQAKTSGKRAGEVSLLQAFEEEARDATLAARNRKTISDTIERLRRDLKNTAQMSDLECKSMHCRLTLLGQISEVSQMIDAIQDDRGKMAGASMMLHRENDEIQVYFAFAGQAPSGPVRVEVR